MSQGKRQLQCLPQSKSPSSSSPPMKRQKTELEPSPVKPRLGTNLAHISAPRSSAHVGSMGFSSPLTTRIYSETPHKTPSPSAALPIDMAPEYKPLFPDTTRRALSVGDVGNIFSRLTTPDPVRPAPHRLPMQGEPLSLRNPPHHPAIPPAKSDLDSKVKSLAAVPVGIRSPPKAPPPRPPASPSQALPTDGRPTNSPPNGRPINSPPNYGKSINSPRSNNSPQSGGSSNSPSNSMKSSSAIRGSFPLFDRKGHDESGRKVQLDLHNGTITEDEALQKAVEESLMEEQTAVERATEQRVRGFRNLGNTCYINSVLNCLLSLTPFIAHLRNAVQAGGDETKTTEFPFTKEFLDVATRSESSPSRFDISVAPLQKALAVTKPQFGTLQQQDAHELLIAVLDLLREEAHSMPWMKSLLLVSTPLGSASRQHPANSSCPVARNFASVIARHFTCGTCGTHSTIYEDAVVVSLALQNSGEGVADRKSSIQTLLQSNFAVEGGLERKCEMAGCKPPDSQPPKGSSCESFFDCFPRVLVIHLKRFVTTLENNKFKTRKAAQDVTVCPQLDLEKLTKDVSFPPPETSLVIRKEDYTLRDEADVTNKYVLVAAVQHIGEMAHKGHYTALVRRKGDEGSYIDDDLSKKWLLYDDHRPVTALNNSSVFGPTSTISKNGYLFFYVHSSFASREWRINVDSPDDDSSSSDSSSRSSSSTSNNTVGALGTR